jgi:hypothetical protein
MSTTFEQLPQLLEMEQRLGLELRQYEQRERRYRNIWVALEGAILAVGLLTPIIVTYRKSGLYPVEFWVWWCTLTPLLTAGCTVALRTTSVQDKCQANRRRIKKMLNLLSQVNTEIPACPDDERAAQLLRSWHNEARKISLDA